MGVKAVVQLAVQTRNDAATLRPATRGAISLYPPAQAHLTEARNCGKILIEGNSVASDVCYVI